MNKDFLEKTKQNKKHTPTIQYNNVTRYKYGCFCCPTLYLTQKQDANCEENTAIDGNIFTDPLIYCPRGDNTRNKGGKCGEGNGSALRAGGQMETTSIVTM